MNGCCHKHMHLQTATTKEDEETNGKASEEERTKFKIMRTRNTEVHHSRGHKSQSLANQRTFC